MEKRFEEIMKNGKEKGTSLSDEEILYILTQAAKKEANLRQEVVTNKIFGSYEDVAHEIFTYLLIKDANGKQGIRWLQEHQTVEHLKNSLFFFVRNEYNGNLRKNKVNQLVYNTDSLDKPINKDGEEMSSPLLDLIYNMEGKNEIEESNGYMNLLKAFENISDEEDSKYIIKYQDKPASKFSFKKLAKIMYEISTGTQIRAKDLDKIIYTYNEESNKYTPADKDSISSLLSELRKSLRMNSGFKRAIGRECI